MNNIKISDDFTALLPESLEKSFPFCSKFFIISDEITHSSCLHLINNFLPENSHHIVIGPGELNKNIYTCQVIWMQLLNGGADRHSLIINLGGGVVTDIGGFVAATFMRGIRFINIPTSLLGMVDASFGGKTGVDLEHYKNIIGSFYNPESVLIWPGFLDTLPDHEWKNGIVEMLKHGLVGDFKLWKDLSNLLNHTDLGLSTDLKSALVKLIASSTAVKVNLVNIDPNEKNERKFLNFGHTVGHALESWSLSHNDKPLSHGNAVAIGMICESFLSTKLCGLNNSELIEIINTLKNLFVPVPINKTAMQKILLIMRSDKKSHARDINMALLRGIAKPVVQDGVSSELIMEAMHFYNSTI